MLHLADILLGAALVATGVLAAAIADRIRGIGRAPASRPRATRRDIPTVAEATEHEVVDALVAAGYSKRAAAAAVAGCSPEQRETIERWTGSALRRLATGVAS